MKRFLSFLILLSFVGNSYSQISMTLGDVTSTSGANISVPLNVENFNNIGSISLKITFTPGVISYVELQNSQFQPIALSHNSSSVSIGWFSLSPLNAGTGKLMDIIFHYNGGTSDIVFDAACQIADGIGATLNVTYNNGSISEGQGGGIGTPLLQSPSNGSADISLTPTLDWSDVTGADEYELQLSTSDVFFDTIIDLTGITSSGYTIGSSVLENSMEYYWRVRAMDDSQTGDWSSVFSFTTESGTIPTGISITIGNITASPNTRVTVPINVTDFNDIGSITLKIGFDTSKVTFVGIENAAATGFQALFSGNNLSIGWFSLSPLNLGNGKLLDLVFDYTESNVPVNFLSGTEITNSSNQILNTTLTSGVITEGEPLPLVPTLNLPADDSVGVSLTPTLGWAITANAVSYSVQLSADSNFVSTIIDQEGITAITLAVSSDLLNYNTKYFWRVKATNTMGSSNWSEVWSFRTLLEPLSAPILASPTNDAVGISINPTLIWNSVNGATSYNIQLSVSSEFSDLIINESQVTTIEYEVTGSLLSHSTKYFWRVSANGAPGTSAYSEIWNFTTILTTPTHVSPADETEDVSLTPSLDWNDVASATSYRIQISLPPDFSELSIDQSDLSVSTYTVLSGVLQENTTYYWRVKASANENSSSWSDAWSFTTMLVPLDTPTLVSPVNNTLDIDPEAVTLDWNDVTDAVSYTLNVSTDAGFTNNIISQASISGSSYSIASGVLNYEQDYFWRVKAVGNGKESGWSGSFKFTTLIQPLQAPALIAPADGVSNLILTPTLDWSNVATATSYGLQVASDSDFNNKVIDATSLGESQYAILAGTLTGSTTYYWRVNAAREGETSDWSVVRSFTTEPPTGVTTFMSGIPESYTLFQNYPNPFNPNTKIRYALPEASEVSIKIVDMLGREVSDLFNGFQSAGFYELNWNPVSISSGTYIYRINVKSESGKEFSDFKKMIFMK
ncbi:MAG: T9SS type A sorting domain-containing protein [Melioribacteraceae bacterium]|nr:T9SS type A sorting domain-containing protein [Melioribacteraceae bacterium]